MPRRNLIVREGSSLSSAVRTGLLVVGAVAGLMLLMPVLAGALFVAKMTLVVIGLVLSLIGGIFALTVGAVTLVGAALISLVAAVIGVGLALGAAAVKVALYVLAPVLVIALLVELVRGD